MPKNTDRDQRRIRSESGSRKQPDKTRSLKARKRAKKSQNDELLMRSGKVSQKTVDKIRKVVGRDARKKRTRRVAKGVGQRQNRVDTAADNATVLQNAIDDMSHAQVQYDFANGAVDASMLGNNFGSANLSKDREQSNIHTREKRVKKYDIDDDEKDREEDEHNTMPTLNDSDGELDTDDELDDHFSTASEDEEGARDSEEGFQKRVKHDDDDDGDIEVNEQPDLPERNDGCDDERARGKNESADEGGSGIGSGMMGMARPSNVNVNLNGSGLGSSGRIVLASNTRWRANRNETLVIEMEGHGNYSSSISFVGSGSSTRHVVVPHGIALEILTEDGQSRTLFNNIALDARAGNGADRSGRNLAHAVLVDSCLSGCNIDYSYVSDCSIHGCNLSNCHIDRSDIHGSNVTSGEADWTNRMTSVVFSNLRD